MFDSDNYTNLTLLALGVLSIIVAIMIYSVRKEIDTEEAPELDMISLNVNEKTFMVEVAKTSAQRQEGLMNRSNLDADKGMLFIFENKFIYPFWMKNTLIPLDIIWLDENKKAVFINENTQPCKNSVEAICKSVVPTASALYVVEFNAGTVKETNIKLGDQFPWEL